MQYHQYGESDFTNWGVVGSQLRDLELSAVTFAWQVVFKVCVLGRQFCWSLKWDQSTACRILPRWFSHLNDSKCLFMEHFPAMFDNPRLTRGNYGCMKSLSGLVRPSNQTASASKRPFNNWCKKQWPRIDLIAHDTRWCLVGIIIHKMANTWSLCHGPPEIMRYHRRAI